MELSKEDLVTPTENGNMKPNGGAKLTVSYLTEKTTTSLQEKKDKPKIEHNHLIWSHVIDKGVIIGIMVIINYIKY